MNATVNGERRELSEGTTLADLVRSLDLSGGGIAVAVNERVVRGGAFADHTLREGDAIEIIRAVAGG